MRIVVTQPTHISQPIYILTSLGPLKDFTLRWISWNVSCSVQVSQVILSVIIIHPRQTHRVAHGISRQTQSQRQHSLKHKKNNALPQPNDYKHPVCLLNIANTIVQTCEDHVSGTHFCSPVIIMFMFRHHTNGPFSRKVWDWPIQSIFVFPHICNL